MFRALGYIGYTVHSVHVVNAEPYVGLLSNCLLAFGPSKWASASSYLPGLAFSTVMGDRLQ